MNKSKFIYLNDWIIIKISGNERMEYLNGIVTQNIEKQEFNKYYRSAFLSPQAKIRSIFWIKKLEDHFILICPDHMKNNLIEDLLKYKLSMNIKLEDITKETPKLYLQFELNDEVPGFENIKGNFIQTDQIIEGEEIKIDALNAYLITNGIPPMNIFLGENPYEIGLNDAVSLEKGCFLGQEPLSRMYHRGRPRKYLYSFEIQGKTSTNTIRVNETEVGTVVAMTQKPNQNQGIAFLNSNLKGNEVYNIDQLKLYNIKRIGSYPEIKR
ncbi:MAG: hypothetical protein OEZ01_07870 [Candidatus Heimdallarchaeota archaeon]|nr:hypothetical protein [Candidatus Heimdallarchaeota archaeon]MDH5645909.1 hypothetical protein [Candidatus Heimdallarchaeota archaeon]